MPKDPIKPIYCTAQTRDGKGGKYKVGQKLELDDKEAANKLLATGRFTEDKEASEKAVAHFAKKEQANADAQERREALTDENEALKARIAELEKAAKTPPKSGGK